MDKLVIVRVDSGMVSVIQRPKDVVVEVRDYDIAGASEDEDELCTDCEGYSFLQAIYED